MSRLSLSSLRNLLIGPQTIHTGSKEDNELFLKILSNLGLTGTLNNTAPYDLAAWIPYQVSGSCKERHYKSHGSG
jgi:hypothetical protein